MVDEVDRATAGRRHHRQAHCGSLLQGLPEGLAGAGVDEDVEGGIRPGEVVATALAEKDRGAVGPPRRVRDGLGEEGSDLGSSGAVTDDHESGAGDGCGFCETVEFLLRGESADIADEHLPGRGQRPPELARPCVPSPPRGEEGVVHAPAPPLHPRYAVVPELLDRRRGGGEREVGVSVHAPDPAPRGVRGSGADSAGRVLGEVTGHIGLVDGDGWGLGAVRPLERARRARTARRRGRPPGRSPPGPVVARASEVRSGTAAPTPRGRWPPGSRRSGRGPVQGRRCERRGPRHTTARKPGRRWW